MRDVVFVVGMGRSGSSALARVLGLCGAALPLDVLPPNVGNPTGYWEPEAILYANERFLDARASSWFDPRPSRRTSPPAVAHDPFVREAADLLRSSFPPGGPLVVKEPRISALLPYWLAAAAVCGLRPVAVHMVRNPDDVAASLKQRDGLGTEQSHGMWLKNSLVAERDTRELPRVFLSYDELLADWEPVVRRCIERLGLPLAITDETRAAVAAFLSPGLRHHASRGPAGGDPASLVARVYAALERARHGPPAPAEFDRLLAEYAASAVPAASMPSWAAPR
jgi:hypothetical protein